MNESEIIALAREYAEEQCKKSTMIDTSNLYEDKLLEFCDVYGFLLRRFCLVEKSKVEETWKEITDVYLAHRHITYDGARYLFNEVLFPEIAKEVEG